MKALDDVLVPPTATILAAVQAIDAGSVRIALVVDQSRALLGTLTDGDVRRGLLRGVRLDEPVTAVMNPAPLTVRREDGREAALALMRRREVHQVPVVDAAGRVVALEVLDDLLRPPADDTWVVLMAGGLGTRLHPLTRDTPKPLLPVGGRPILETTLRTLIGQGYRRFCLALNYKAEMFRAHFGDGSRWGVEIAYLQEPDRMGTAGALSLLPQRPAAPFVVMNGDLLTAIDLRLLLAFHREQNGAATMCVREHVWEVPFGVVEADGHRLRRITEKPRQAVFVSAGIYALEPDILDLLPRGERLDMPDLFERVMASGREALVFPLREYWMDVGRPDDLERARDEFSDVFGG